MLTASVSDPFTIHLRDPNGVELNGNSLPQGAYTLELDDNGTNHNFHLLGPAVSCVPRQDCASSIPGTGHETWTVNFTTGSVSPVTYQCDVHGALMRGTFTISGPPPPPPPPPPPLSPSRKSMPVALGPTFTGLEKPEGLKVCPSRAALTV